MAGLPDGRSWLFSALSTAFAVHTRTELSEPTVQQYAHSVLMVCMPEQLSFHPMF